MENVIVKPQLGFPEAVGAAFGKLGTPAGRSRRSEFWWFMLVFIIAQWIVSMALQWTLPVMAASAVSVLLWGLAFAATVRRLHDTGKSGWWVIISWAAMAVYNTYTVTQSDAIIAAASDPKRMLAIFSDPIIIVSGLTYFVTFVAILIFCILDSHQGSNKYGPSPKYTESE